MRMHVKASYNFQTIQTLRIMHYSVSCILFYFLSVCVGLVMHKLSLKTYHQWCVQDFEQGDADIMGNF